MDIALHLAQAAAVILLIQLIILILIFAGIFGGLAFGLRWVRGKTPWAFEKADSYIKQGTGYLHQGTGYAAMPVIKLVAGIESAEAFVRALQKQARQAHRRQSSTTESKSAEDTEAPVPLV